MVDDETAYEALDGARIEIPPCAPFEERPGPRFGAAERSELLTLILGSLRFPPPVSRIQTDRLIARLNGEDLSRFPPEDPEIRPLMGRASGYDWLRRAFERLPTRAALLAAGLSLEQIARPGPGEVWEQPLRRALQAPDVDLRRLEALALAAERRAPSGALMALLLKRRRWMQGGLCGVDLPRKAVWPWVAANLAALEADFAASGGVALGALEILPATPRRFLEPLLEMGLSADLSVQSRARRLLAGAPEVEARLLARLESPEPEIRARALAWATERPDPRYEAPLRRRLAAETAAHPRAAILRLLARIGADLAEGLAPEALEKEALAGLKRSAAAPPGWLPPDALEGLRWRDGTPATEALGLWWLRLALKQGKPGGDALFGLRLERLHPDDAARMGRRILEGWLGETERRDEARPEGPASKLNDALAQKGALALARRAPEGWAAGRVRAFLKTHPKRVGACAALLDLLGSMAGAAAAQAVLEARGHRKPAVRRSALAIAARLAEARGWTPGRMEDRAVSDAGLDAEGRMILPCGEGKAYLARLDERLELALFNPAGRPVGSLPKTGDEAAAARKRLLEARKDLALTLKIQSARLREAMQVGRRWEPEDWREVFPAHPVLRKMAESLVWFGLDAEGGRLASFRPRPEGDLLDAGDSPVDLGAFAGIGLGHAALSDPATARLWEAHLRDYEIASPFAQFGFPLPPAPEDAFAASDREGWVLSGALLRARAEALGYRPGPTGEHGAFHDFRRDFPACGLSALLCVSGLHAFALREDPFASAALRSLSFLRLEDGAPAPLAEVPAALYADLWRDYLALAEGGVFDPAQTQGARAA